MQSVHGTAPTLPFEAAEPSHTLLSREAFERRAGEREALEESELLPVNLDIPAAVTTVFTALPKLRALRGDLEQFLPAEHLVELDALEDYALGAYRAYVLHRSAQADRAQAADLLGQAFRQREVLHADAKALALHGLLSLEQVDAFRAGTGYREVAFGLTGLVDLLRSRWAELGTKVAATPEQLDVAERLADSIMMTVGLRDQVQVPGVVAASQRQRACTLLLRTYDQLRRAVQYLRWNTDDADSFAPALYARRKAGSSSRKGSPPHELPDAPGGPGAEVRTAPWTPTPGASAPASPTDTPQARAFGPPGTPSSNPFVG